MKPILILGGAAALYLLLKHQQQKLSTPPTTSANGNAVPGGLGASGGYSVSQLESKIVTAGVVSEKPASSVNKTQVTTSLIGSGVGVTAASAGLSAGLSAGTLTPLTTVPLVGAIVVGGVLIGTTLYKVLNHPYGTCGPNSTNMADFLSCWDHPIDYPQLPFFSNKMIGPRGWANWAYCRGAQTAKNGKDWLAKNGQFAGCQPWGANEKSCDTNQWIKSSGKSGCVAAPAGAIVSLPDGTFLDSAGRNLGGVRARP